MSPCRISAPFAAMTCLLSALAWSSGAAAADSHGDLSLAGTWTLVAADVLHPDGSRGHDYGDAPKGQLLIDRVGHYSLQIFRADRPRFANPDKAKGTAQEFQAAVLGASTHFGTIAIEANQLVFHMEGASFPNWDGQEQRRTFELHGDTLSYRVPARPNGDVPVSVWRRVDDAHPDRTAMSGWQHP